jgi:hypothetical protein
VYKFQGVHKQKDIKMKIFQNKIVLLLILFAIPLQSLFSQDNNKIQGNWLGTLKISTIELRIVFKVSKNEDGSLTALLDSPDQGAFDIKVDSVLFNDLNVKFIVLSIAGFYEGKFELDISGTWNQGGSSFPLTLKRSEEIEAPKRPQEPKPPFSYFEEDVTFENNEAGLTLAGTFTYLENVESLPVVILISGSGPQDRNEELLGHKPFLVLADHLTRNGIAVLRFDDRGVGKSTGDFSSATTEDFASDVIAGIEYLKSRNEINKNKIGLIGHSEGGLIAPIAAIQSDDVDFMVLMAGPGMLGKELLRLQSALILRADGTDEETITDNVETALKMYDIVINEKDSLAARVKLKKISDESYAEMSEEEKAQIGDPDKFFDQQVNILLSPWFRFFLGYDPYPALIKVNVPLLAINGELDLQVPPKENLELIEKAMKEGGNTNYKIAELKGLNHLFQEAKTGSPNEYAKIEQTISPTALNMIYDWIMEITK